MRSLPASLQSKLSQQMQTVHNDADPRMEVVVARARTEVVDYTYWTVETIRETSGLGDVSVAPRRFRPYGSPNRIYEIHVHNGEVKTAIREYPDRLKDGWKDQFSLGAGSSVGIAFDGRWERYRKLWRLVTEEKPWLFWVDGNNVLWRQHWDDVATKTQLDTGVTRVRAIRAWKNVNLPDKDQGIVVGYIKTDGTVWYRNYCQQADYSYVWENAKQLTQFTATAVSLNMFITNDYRMGFIIEASNGQVHWLITPRNWSGMALERENIAVNAKATVDFIPVTYHHAMHDERLEVSATADVAMLFGRTDNTVVELENLPMTRVNEFGEEYQDWGFKVRVRLNFESMNVPTFTLTDATTLSGIAIASVTVIEQGYEYVLNIDDVVHEFGLNEVEANVILSVSSFMNEAGYWYDAISQEFTPVNLIPPDLPLPVVSNIWNE